MITSDTSAPGSRNSGYSPKTKKRTIVYYQKQQRGPSITSTNKDKCDFLSNKSRDQRFLLSRNRLKESSWTVFCPIFTVEVVHNTFSTLGHRAHHLETKLSAGKAVYLPAWFMASCCELEAVLGGVGKPLQQFFTFNNRFFFLF